jgi:preprotein translocase subunit SecG
MTALLFITIGLFAFVAIVLILLVLIQKGRGGGLSSAFGGGGGNTAFGSKTGDVLTWATSIVFGVFLLLAIALSLLADRVSANRAAAAGTTPPAQQDVPSNPGPTQ